MQEFIAKRAPILLTSAMLTFTIALDVPKAKAITDRLPNQSEILIHQLNKP